MNTHDPNTNPAADGDAFDDPEHPEIPTYVPETIPLDFRRPDVPVNLNELAALKSGALEIIEARAAIVAALRKAAISATTPPDWVLNRQPAGQEIGFLQDNGGDRVRDLYGIEIFGVSTPERIATADPKVFHYLIRGSGRCKLTGQTIENVEGGRSSTDDFCKDKTGVELELAVRKAARANLDGIITRTLAGLQAVSIDELRAAWANSTYKRVESCIRGHGYGSIGAAAGPSDIEPPICPHCNTRGVYRAAKGDRKPFYGCPKYATHPNKKWFVDAAEWIAQAAKLTPAQAAGFTGKPTTPPTADEIFGADK